MIVGAAVLLEAILSREVMLKTMVDVHSILLSSVYFIFTVRIEPVYFSRIKMATYWI